MNSALVNPWRSWGTASPLPPKRGAVTTFLWNDGWAHVSFLLGEIGNYVVCLGGRSSAGKRNLTLCGYNAACPLLAMSIEKSIE